jgi:hypothetical protein
MANWCSNTVAFEGKPESINEIHQLFRAMAEKQEQENIGQLPAFVLKSNKGYFFGIWQEDDNLGMVQYQTKWSPNIEILEKIAEYYKVDFTLDYEEMGNLIYGKAIYKNGVRNDIYLEDEDFEQYQYNEEEDCYLFESESYESDCEILETLLERKITKQQS